MKLYQNRIDRFSVIAKKLLDQHATDYFNDCRKDKDQYEAFSSHYELLGSQLEQYATEFIKNTNVSSKYLADGVWKKCNYYLALFERTHAPGSLNQAF